MRFCRRRQSCVRSCNVRVSECASDVDGGTCFTLEAVNAVGGKAEITSRYWAVLRVAMFESVAEFMGAVVDADRKILLLENVRGFGVNV